MAVEILPYFLARGAIVGVEMFGAKVAYQQSHLARVDLDFCWGRCCRGHGHFLISPRLLCNFYRLVGGPFFHGWCWLSGATTGHCQHQQQGQNRGYNSSLARN